MTPRTFGGGRQAAVRMYPINDATCEHSFCEEPALDHHHIDGNPLNNEDSNIALLCRRHHMAVDGRAAQLAEAGRASGLKQKTPLRPCRICGRLAKPLRYGRCGRCSQFFQAHHRERPSRVRQGIRPELASPPLPTSGNAEVWASPTLSVGEVAKLFGISTQTARNWGDSGRLPVMRNPRGHRLFPTEAVKKLHGAVCLDLENYLDWVADEADEECAW